MAMKSFFKHWPTMLLGLVVAAILLVAVFSYQLDQREIAVVTTFGRSSEVTEPGLHFRWPYPFQRIHRFDHRVRCFEGGLGKLEETMTADSQNIIAGIYVNYRISDAGKFFTTFENITKAEDQLNSWMRGAKNAAFGQYKFSQVVNVNPELMKLGEIQKEITASLKKDCAPLGIEIISVGINTINVPSTITKDVFARMTKEREIIANKYLAQGTTEASTIRTAADKAASQAIAEAEAEAKAIRAKGDAEAAQYYAVFRKNPELAEFLRKLDSLKAVMKTRTTLVLDTNVAPFDLLKPGSETLGPRTGANK